MVNSSRLALLVVFALSVPALLPERVSAELILSTAGMAGTIDFTGFTGAGLQPGGGGGTLDSNTFAVSGFSDGSAAFGATNTSGDYARGTTSGGVTFGGLYAFDTGAGNVGLGAQPSGADFTPGTITLQVLNNTGHTTTSFRIAYDVVVFNDQNRSNSFNFSVSTDGVMFTPLAALDFASPAAEDVTPAWLVSPRSTAVAASVASGSNFFLRWTSTDVGGSGSRDEFALDNISVTAIPEPSSLAFVVGATILAFIRRRGKHATAIDQAD